MKRDPATNTSKFNKYIEVVKGEPGQRKRTWGRLIRRSRRSQRKKKITIYRRTLTLSICRGWW